MVRFNTVTTKAALAAMALLTLPAAAQARGPEIRVTGGGVADFLDPNPCHGFDLTEFGESVFAVAARVDDDGDVRGTFLCGVRDCIIDDAGTQADILVVGEFTEVVNVSRKGQRRVTLAGDAILLIEGVRGIADGPFPFSVELREGGVGVGGFGYTDPVTLLGAGLEYGDGLVDDGSDQELITRGRIRIRFDD